MSVPGDVDRPVDKPVDEVLVQARAALLDALGALKDQLESVTVVGAQAVYLHTGDAPVPVAEATSDGDLGIDVRTLADDPRIEQAMAAAGFRPDPISGQPGAWLSPAGIPVDLMVPAAIAGTGRRSVTAPPHDGKAMRRTHGLEAAVVDYKVTEIRALSPHDARTVAVRVAGPAALLVAKLHKIGERRANPRRLEDKDAYDIYRLLVTVRAQQLGATLAQLAQDPLAGPATQDALRYLEEMFAAGSDAQGSQMAGRAEELVGAPEVVAAACAALAGDVLTETGSR
jgi:hypothetical protein